MEISVDVSYYPLNESYKAPVKAFIANVKRNPKLEVHSGRMSTQVFGEMEEVMTTLTRCMHDAFELPHSVFVLKVINAGLKPKQ